jgi:hypothetical protein
MDNKESEIPVKHPLAFVITTTEKKALRFLGVGVLGVLAGLWCFKFHKLLGIGLLIIGGFLFMCGVCLFGKSLGLWDKGFYQTFGTPGDRMMLFAEYVRVVYVQGSNCSRAREIRQQQAHDPAFMEMVRRVDEYKK